MIGKVERVPLREVWKNEALDFTPWLQDNIDILNEQLDLSLSSAEREKPAGGFNVDLVAEDDVGDVIIIENQLEKSNHEHLGKLVTYLTALDAKAAIWIVSDPRPEHIAAISWLNESSSASFYLVKVEAIKIGDSPPAPLLTLIVGPTEEGRVLGNKKKELAERDSIRRRFWEQLLDRAKSKTKLHAAKSPSHRGWVGTSAGKSGLSFIYVIGLEKARVELYIDRGKDAENENKRIFDKLFASKKEIEAAFKEPLEWQRLEGKRACRILKQIDIGGLRDEDKWPQIQDAMIDAMVRLEQALKPHIKKLAI